MPFEARPGPGRRVSAATASRRSPRSVRASAALELATIDLDANRALAALTALDAALARFPKSPEAPATLISFGRALEKQNRRADAQTRFLKFAETAPKDPWSDDALDRAARLALEQEDPKTARRSASSFAAHYPGSPLLAEVRLIEARACSLEGKPSEAVAILEPLLAPQTATTAQPKSANPPPDVLQAIRYELAIAYRALGRSADAEATLAKLTTEGSGALTADAQFLLGQSRIEAGHFADGIGPLEKYLAANPKGEVAEFAFAHIVVAQIGINRLDDAWKTLANLAERFPQSKSLPATRLRLAEAALRAHDLQRAIEQFRHVADIEPPKGAPAGKASGDHSHASGDHSHASGLSLRIRALAGLASALLALDKPGEAAAAYGRILELAPKDPIASQIALQRAHSLESGPEAAAALDAYSQLIERYGDSNQAVSASLARARLLAKLGRNPEAAAEFERLFANPKLDAMLSSAGLAEDSVLADWGWALVDAQKPVEADRVFTRLLENHPESPYAADARFNLAESASEARDYAKVIKLLAPLVAPGTANSKSGSVTEKSVSDNAKRSPEREPGQNASFRRLLPAVLYRLGRTQVELKDWQPASATFDRLLSDFPENPYRRDAEYLRGCGSETRGFRQGPRRFLSPSQTARRRV